MTLDMTFEAREKIIRQEEYQDGRLDIIFSHYDKGYTDYDIALDDSNLTEEAFATKFKEWKSNHS